MLYVIDLKHDPPMFLSRMYIVAPSTLVSDCFIKLDPMTVTYTYTLTWTITNFDCSIANRIIRFEVGLTNFTTNGNGFRLLENNVGETKTVYTVIIKALLLSSPLYVLLPLIFPIQYSASYVSGA